MLASLTKEEKHFQQAAYEIYTTELDYVEDLRVLLDVRASRPGARGRTAPGPDGDRGRCS